MPQALTWIGRKLTAALLCGMPMAAAVADTLTAQEQVLSTPYNLYSPSPLNDGGTYDLWYGGWATSGTQDAIYFMSTTNLANWPTQGTPVITTSNVPNSVHVNDPSVVKLSGPTPYVMFFTAALNNVPGCGDPAKCGNTIWYATSSDGMHWGNYNKAPIPATDPSSAGTLDQTQNIYPSEPWRSINICPTLWL